MWNMLKKLPLILIMKDCMLKLRNFCKQKTLSEELKVFCFLGEGLFCFLPFQCFDQLGDAFTFLWGERRHFFIRHLHSTLVEVIL